MLSGLLSIVSATGAVTWANHVGPWKRKKSVVYRRIWKLLDREKSSRVLIKDHTLRLEEKEILAHHKLLIN